MASKRKWSEVNDSDDEEPALGRQVLPVANLPTDFDGIPQDGLQYLFTVRRDALKLPRTTRVDNPYEIKEEIMEDVTDAFMQHPANSVLPSEEWRDVFLKRFRNFKTNCTQPTIHIDMPTPGRKLMPDRKDRDAWWAFLTGRPEAEWNPPKKPKGQKNKPPHNYGRGMRAFQDVSEYEILPYDDAARVGPSSDDTHVNEEREVEQAITINPAESLPTPSSTPAPDNPADRVRDSSSNTNAQPEPTPTLLRTIDHRYALHLLMYFAYWINLYLEQSAPKSCTISETHARWMFVLLSRVDDYITADEQSTLRTLARGCMSLIKERIQEHSTPSEGSSSAESNDAGRTIGVSACWMVVTAITGVWGQKDLWIDAESMLSGLST
ncbi:hypothetical protein EIP86_010123 [Pleurotus ostreatoroseus]|nr:hypothetical protein EIP86_010123 [Pleurotus ostreatoroseus]